MSSMRAHPHTRGLASAIVGLAGSMLTLPAAATLVNCVGASVTDGPAIQAALDAGGTVQLQGVCTTAQPLLISQPKGMANDEGETWLQGGVLYGPGIVIDGARRVRISGTEIRSSATGITVNSAIMVRIESAYISSLGDGIVLNSIAGVWIVNSHLNGVGEGTIGIRAGYSPEGFEALWVLGTLIETHDTGIWLGGWGNIRNVTISDTYIDRSNNAAILLAPQDGAAIYNVQIRGLWANGSGRSIAMDGQGKNGTIYRLMVSNSILLGLDPIDAPLSGKTKNLGIVYGPQEPG